MPKRPGYPRADAGSKLAFSRRGTDTITALCCVILFGGLATGLKVEPFVGWERVLAGLVSASFVFTFIDRLMTWIRPDREDRS